MEISEKLLTLEHYINKDLLEPHVYKAILLFLNLAKERNREDPHFLLSLSEASRLYNDDDFMEKVSKTLDEAYHDFKLEAKEEKLDQRDINNVQREAISYNFIASRFNLDSGDKRKFSHLIGIAHDLYRPKEVNIQIRITPSILTYLKGNKAKVQETKRFVFESDQFEKNRLSEKEIAIICEKMKEGQFDFPVQYLQNAFDHLKNQYMLKIVSKKSYQLACKQKELVNHLFDECCRRIKKSQPEFDGNRFRVLSK